MIELDPWKKIKKTGTRQRSKMKPRGTRGNEIKGQPKFIS